MTTGEAAPPHPRAEDPKSNGDTIFGGPDDTLWNTLARIDDAGWDRLASRHHDVYVATVAPQQCPTDNKALVLISNVLSHSTSLPEAAN